MAPLRMRSTVERLDKPSSYVTGKVSTFSPKPFTISSLTTTVQKATAKRPLRRPRRAPTRPRTNTRRQATERNHTLRRQPLLLHDRRADPRAIQQMRRDQAHNHGSGPVPKDAVRFLFRGVLHTCRRARLLEIRRRHETGRAHHQDGSGRGVC